MKKIAAVAALVLMSTIPAITNAHPVEDKPQANHSGGTDANGCHYNHKTGDYHCHNPK